MTFHINLVPAYGRDYTSRADLVADLAKGKDFVIADAQSQWDRKPVNLEQLRASGKTLAFVRYGKLRKVARVDLNTVESTK